MTDPAWRHRAIVAAFLALSSGGGQANADCAFEPQGEGRVAAVVDGRSFRLDDGREVRLAGIERAGTDKVSARASLAALVSGRHVTLHGEDDAPDRYAASRRLFSRTARKLRCRVRCYAAARRWPPPK